MKTLKITIRITATFFMLFLFTSSIFAQLEFVGNYADGMGIAGWNADGSGPEPYGNGHGDIFYYTASRDYLDGADYCGAKLTDLFNGFPTFEQSLIDNGYTYEQVTLKSALADLGDDVEGIDYFTVDGLHYCNFYPIVITIELDGEPLIEAIGNYGMYITGTNVRDFESGFLKIHNISNENTEAVANAFMADMGSEELQMIMTISPDNGPTLTGNGRLGAYIDITCTFEKGLPEIPMQGLISENMGTASWNADGTGPEPYGNGHEGLVYYSASVDYDGINPNPEACLAHFLEGSQGFRNTLLQLQYRGYLVGDLKLKMGLSSLGPDVESEDWGVENGLEWLNEYNNKFTIELNGEPILEVMQDTNKMTYINPSTVTWATESSMGKVYDISSTASTDAQFVAQSFLKDIGSHYLGTHTYDITYHGSMPSGNGRSGVYYDLNAAALVGVHEKATFIPEGNVSGTWTLEDSPVYIEGPVTIENDQTLTIEPGVRVATRGIYPITVVGNIVAEGTAEIPIMFTASNPNITWDGLDYEGQNIVSTNPSVFDHCIFQYGQAHGGGEYNSGGIFAVRDYNDIEIYNSTFRHNIADVFSTTYVTCGGAVALWNASPFIQKCIFYDNYALDYAGAILAYTGSNPVISNCLFYENESYKGGAIAFYSNSNGVLINNTIGDNQSSFGGGLYFYDNSNPEIINNIIYSNEAALVGNQIYFSTPLSTPGFYYNDIQDGMEGFGGSQFLGDYLFNMDEDPIFEDNPDFPYLIGAGSPCINTGTPDTSMWYYSEYLPATCLCGQPRILNDHIEIGAYERLATGIAESVTKDDFMSLRPNPVNQSAIITYELPENSNVKIEIYNFLGQKIETLENRRQYEGKHTLQYNAGHLRTGAYFILITLQNKIHTLKFQKIN